ncbi:hypothetical protein GCM10023191_092090 [Actinoallomurus oryzae]|uniref:Uncharacterized protein n=1 Tax=Actinoallomurus oryzae TaxID=502180 RepID=A0ABP8R4X6_9ACTN
MGLEWGTDVVASVGERPDTGYVTGFGSGDSAPEGRDMAEMVGVYPIYASERDLVYAAGFDVLWNLDWDRFDPARPPVA